MRKWLLGPIIGAGLLAGTLGVSAFAVTTNSNASEKRAQTFKQLELFAEIVAKAQASGEFKTTVTPAFAALAFYGAIEQVLTGWIFELLPGAPEDFDQAKDFVVETICGGLDAVPAPA